MTLKIAEVEKSVLSVEESMSTKISDVGEYLSNKIAEVERSVTSVEKAMSAKIEDSIRNIKEQIKNEVEQCLKLQPKQFCELTVPMIKTQKISQ